MPRDLPVGNGRLLINFDFTYQLRDLYYPHVGKENQSTGLPFRFGVWCDGEFSWVHTDEWEKTMRYLPDTLVTEVTLLHDEWKLKLVCHDAVDFHEDLYFKRIRLENLAPTPRKVRLFFCHDFHLYEYEIGDTAYLDPETKGIIHYKAQRYFLMNCLRGEQTGWDQYACGKKGLEGREGTWRDCEDGTLSMNSIDQGSVDSACAVEVSLDPQGSTTMHYWMAAGLNYLAVRKLNDLVHERTPDRLVNRTRDFWKMWVKKEDFDFHDLPENLIRQFKTSLLILRTQVDVDGGIVAANDSDITHGAGDTYSYVWTRDGALVARALASAGYRTLSSRFFFFCNQILGTGGYFFHNYNADGSPGSNWHSWLAHDSRLLPIQEDETAIVLWALWEQYSVFRDVELVRMLYRHLIVEGAEFLCRYRYNRLRLPLPSFDLWEERRGIHGWTVASVYGGLMAAGNFASAFGDHDRAEKYLSAAGEIKTASDGHLWRPELNRFARTIHILSDGSVRAEPAVDAANMGLWFFGMYEPDDPRVEATMKSIEERLWVKTKIGGVARYEDDHYHQISKQVDQIPGNPWFVCTLWLAQWYIARAGCKEDLARARELMDWAARRALPSGVLAEQVHPETGVPLSVSPLTWSHATFVLCLMEYLDKLSELEICDKCQTPVYLKEGFRIRKRGNRDA